jgi:prolyl-tRNA synthetase
MLWCGKPECEAKVKDETKATIRCLPFEAAEEAGKCVVCATPTTTKRAVFARSY